MPFHIILEQRQQQLLFHTRLRKLDGSSDSVWVPEAGDDEVAHPAESPDLLSAGAEPKAGDDECGHGLHRTSLHT